MTIKTLVEFAHDQWGEPKLTPNTARPTTPEPEGHEFVEGDEELTATSRPEVPDWVDDSDQLQDFGDEDQLEVEGAPSEDEAAEWKPPSGSNASADVLAYYLPFHLYGRARWGIYIRGQAIGWLAKKIKVANVKRQPSLMDRLAAARKFLWEHEAFHAQVEFAATRLEVLTFDRTTNRAKPVYVPYFGAGVPSIRAAREEAVANAQAITRVSRFADQAIGVGLREWCENQGVGYRHFGPYAVRGGLKRGYRLCGLSLCRTIDRVPHSPGWPGDFLLGDIRFRPAEVPTRLVGPLPSWVRLVRQFKRVNGIQAWINVGREHQPPHLHVQFKPGEAERSVTWPDFEALAPKRPAITSDQKARLREYVKHFEPGFEQRAALAFGTPPPLSNRGKR